MFVSEDLQVNEQGHLTIGGVDTVSLAKQYGTPLYVMDEDLIRKHCRAFQQSIDRFYQGKGLVCYASKAFSCKAIYRVMQQEGMGIDVVSGGELYTAMQTGFDSSKICFHGNNKTTEIDAVMVYRSGIYVFEHKNYSGWIFGNSKSRSLCGRTHGKFIHVGFADNYRTCFF